MEKFEKLLKNLDFSNGEIKVFLALLKSPLTASELAKEVKINRSNIYRILEKLESKKLIFRFKEKNKTLFKVSRLGRINELIKEKIDKLKKQEKEWKKLTKEIQKKSKKERFSLEMYEGIEELKEVLENILKKRKTVYAFGYEGLFEEYLGDWWIDFIKRRAKEGIRFKGIFNWHKDAGKFYTPPLTEVKYTDFRRMGKIEVAFTDEFVWIFSFEEKPKIVLIKSHLVAKGLKSYFDFIWNKAKKIK